MTTVETIAEAELGGIRFQRDLNLELGDLIIHCQPANDQDEWYRIVKDTICFASPVLRAQIESYQNWTAIPEGNLLLLRLREDVDPIYRLLRACCLKEEDWPDNTADLVDLATAARRYKISFVVDELEKHLISSLRADKPLDMYVLAQKARFRLSSQYATWECLHRPISYICITPVTDVPVKCRITMEQFQQLTRLHAQAMEKADAIIKEFKKDIPRVDQELSCEASRCTSHRACRTMGCRCIGKPFLSTTERIKGDFGRRSVYIPYGSWWMPLLDDVKRDIKEKGPLGLVFTPPPRDQFLNLHSNHNSFASWLRFHESNPQHLESPRFSSLATSCLARISICEGCRRLATGVLKCLLGQIQYSIERAVVENEVSAHNSSPSSQYNSIVSLVQVWTDMHP